MDNRKWMYHPEHGARLFPDLESQQQAHAEGGWYDSPADFPAVAEDKPATVDADADPKRTALEAEAAALGIEVKDSWPINVLATQISKARKKAAQE